MPELPEKQSTSRILRYALATASVSLLFFTTGVWAVGTRVGTLIESSASVDFIQGGAQQTAVSNLVSFRVAERIDVAVTLQSGQVVVSSGDIGRELLLTLTNIGNGEEVFRLAADSILSGDDFDPMLSAPNAIYFDTDASGDFSAGDVAYNPGVNDPGLAADESINLLLLNDIPATAANAQIGRSQLSASAITGSGTSGQAFPGEGDDGVDAVLGATGATATAFGEYIVDGVEINVVKSQAVADPNGGSEPIVGATITYTIEVGVTNTGLAAAAAIDDPIPAWSTFVPNSITLNGSTLSDATDDDAGEYDATVVPSVVVRLGDLTQADGVQTVVFQVTID